MGKYDIIPSNIKRKENKHAARQRKIRCKSDGSSHSQFSYTWCPELRHIVISTVRVLLGFLSVHHWFGIAFDPQYSNEIHRTSSVRKSLTETREKTTAQKLARPVSLVLSICFVDLYNRDRYAGSSTELGAYL